MSGGKKQTAVIGCGWFGRAHIRNMDNLSNLVSVCDANEKIAEKVAKQYGVNSYSDVGKMLEDESIDAVSIVTPPRYIPSIALECAKKGVDVLLEKPCALKLSELDQLFAYKDSVRFMPGFLELFNPVVDELKKHVSEIGDVMTIDSSRIGLYPKRNWGIGVMMDLGVHDVYLHRELAKILFGDTTVVEVSSVLKYMTSEEHFEDAIFVLLKFHKMVTCISANWITPSKARKLKVAGSKASLEVDFITGTIKKIWGEDLKGDNPASIEKLYIPLRRDEPLARELKTFLYSDKPPVDLNDAHDVLKTTLQALHQI
ncbi:MAG: Gfo/Idh/MocA family protein [Promethearchaeota archaeon]